MLRTQGYSSPANSAANSSAAAVLAAEIPLPSIWLNRMQGVDLPGLFLTGRAISGDGKDCSPLAGEPILVRQEILRDAGSASSSRMSTEVRDEQ
jgi:hypothetical protein